MDTMILLISGMLSSIAGGLFASQFVRKLVYLILKNEPPKKTYSERLSDLTSSLTKASAEVDSVLREMAQVAKEREASVKELDAGLSDLEKREKELKDKIALLQSVPIPVAEHFAKLVEPGERRSARRDYMLFFSGVVVTTIIAVILQLFALQDKVMEPANPPHSQPATQVEKL
jgi:hypothetical protein